MKISIVTINYNNLEGLKKTIESVFSQTFKDVEYIVIDGGSSDGGKEYLDSLPRERFASIVSEPDGGLYDAMNKGISHSSGDYVIFMNSGDVFFDDLTLEKIFSKNKYDSDVLYGSTLYGYEDGYVLRKPRELSVLERELPFCHQAVFVKGDLIRNRKFDLQYRFISDYDMLYHFWKGDKQFEEIPQIVAIYDASGVSASKKNSWRIYEERCLIHGLKPSKTQFRIAQAKGNLKGLLRTLIPGKVRDKLLGRNPGELEKYELTDFKSFKSNC